MADPFDLARFVTAQEGVYPRALAELKAGRKRSHWMWFIFPQLKGLGHSSTAEFYGITGRAEAEAYLAHPILGPRLREATQAAIDANASSLRALLGSPDDLKFRSAMSLFAAIEPAGIFAQALERYSDGVPDPRTIALLG